MTEGSSSSPGFWHVLTQQLKLSDVLNERNLIPHISNITIAQTKDINHHNMMFSFKNHIRFGVVQKQAREGGSRGNLVLLLEPESLSLKNTIALCCSYSLLRRSEWLSKCIRVCRGKPVNRWKTYVLITGRLDIRASACVKCRLINCTVCMLSDHLSSLGTRQWLVSVWWIHTKFPWPNKLATTQQRKCHKLRLRVWYFFTSKTMFLQKGNTGSCDTALK